ncbi:MAG: hypothetical protein K6E17_09115 [Clostridiales bacterium]|nr:hypothetical protein [Clostridiales bacterium]
MKKILAWILVLGLMMMAALPGMAEETAEEAEAAAAEAVENLAAPGLFDLYDVNGDDVKWLGIAVPVVNGLAMTAGCVVPENCATLVITDGVNVWKAAVYYRDNGNALVTIAVDVSEANPLIGPFSGTGHEEALVAGDCTVRTADANQSRINRTVSSLTPIIWEGYYALVARLNGDALPGSPLLDEEGNLAGIVAAQYAEGDHRVVILSLEGIRQSLVEASANEEAAKMRAEIEPEGFTVTVEENRVTLDWSAMTLPECAEGERPYVVVSDIDNSYLTYFGFTEDTSWTLLLTPGRTYVSGILVSKDTPDRTPDRYVITTLPEAEKLTDYGFESRVLAVAEKNAAGEVVPVEEVTEELLRSGRAYFYSSSTYQVDRTYDDLTLLITLTDPNGENYRYETGWVYDPAYMDDDTWSVAFTETGLLEMLNKEQGGYPKGEYTLAFYVGGKLADSVTFELK